MTPPRSKPDTAGAGISSVVELPGGRVIGYRIYGDPNGRPVIALHGTPGSRFKFASAHEAAAARGLALYSLDRWGYGLTSARQDPTLHAFASEIGAFADRLAVGRFRVIGISGGGPFAASLAAVLPERVVSLALVSPVGPIVGVVPTPALSPFHTACFRVAPRIPGAIGAAFAAMRLGLKFAPARTLRIVNSRSEVDRLTAADPEIAAHLARTFREGLEPGTAGAAIDMAIFSRPWNVKLSRADLPARLWIGTADRNVPAEAARTLARELPRCDLIELDGAGHLWVSRNADEVLAWIASHG